jgi:hypothetical protein
MTISPSPGPLVGESSQARLNRLSVDEDADNALRIDVPAQQKTILAEKAVTWMSLPHKDQLAILTFARVSEPLVQSSIRVSVTFSMWRRRNVTEPLKYLVIHILPTQIL